MLRGIIIFTWILIAPLTALADSFSGPPTDISLGQNGNISLPISPFAEIYAKRAVISFEICGGGALFKASQNAAQLWNSQLSGRVELRVRQASCSETARIRNGRSELYYSDPGAQFHRAVGLYMGILDRTRDEIAEEDIAVDQEISDLVYLTNIITHEFGHALGLNHARGATCRNSVMAEVACSSFPTPPTSVDIAAAKRIYQASTTQLSDFDQNSNGLIDNIEFFAGLDQWLHNSITDTQFFELIDAWLNNTRISRSASAKFSLLDAERVELYDLSGRLIGTFSGASLERALSRFPQETFIYRAFVNGKWRLGKVLFKNI